MTITGEVLYFYHPETGLYYDTDGVQIKNPFILQGYTKDPATGWDIVRDDNGTFRYFRDSKTGQCYDAYKNPIDDPDNKR